MRALSSCCAYAILTVLFQAPSAWAQTPRPVPLQSGPFRYIQGTELGKAINFENEIDRASCYPLIVTASGQVVAWLSAAYAFDNRLLVKRCLEFDPGIEQIAGERSGSENQWWEQARLSVDHDSLITSRLRVPYWSQFASAAFCARFIAYWGFRAEILTPAIYDLRTNTIVASRSLGRVELETDDRGYLPEPHWDDNCSTASFSGARVNKPDTTLTAKATAGK